MSDFKESEHPRDKDGKFTSNGGQSSGNYQQEVNKRIKWAKEHNIDIPLTSDGTLDDLKLQEIYDSNSKIPPKEVYGFRNMERKNTSHHIRHAKDMGYKDQKQYEKGAIDFWKNGDGKIYYSNARGYFCKYNLKNNKYVVVDKEGIIKTFFLLPNKDFNKYKSREEYIDV